ncbi:hypothetical protein GR160_15845 [Flavobacterium sp. Sd200]|uniref:DUF3450 domain-containing protein n=1 Tax=Flavobacterium sp. Sd200 TaxID=2692211 RepID=UPI0013695380|nr:DUF3450 domain-containing protein [Flavobacterium sp. Sd200]MXN92702.1 hypothetical protein [Flavobacterium sp. Sd200]
MKTTKFLVAGLLLIGAMQVNGQTNVATSTLTSRGLEAGTAGQQSVFFGYQTGKASIVPSGGNTFIGHQAGASNTIGDGNSFVGTSAGFSNTTGYSNTFNGLGAGIINTTGHSNTFTGNGSGQSNITGQQNVFIGVAAGANNQSGNDNVFIGNNAGELNNGSGNIFLGMYAGALEENTNNKLYIENSFSSTPLIWGDFANDLLKLNGKVGIGGVTSFPTTAGTVNVSAYKLFVKGGILTEEVRVHLATGWADYVFAKDYKLPTLTEVEQYINTNGHLPNVPSASSVEADGIEVGNMAKIHQEKIEELTLYAIEQNKQIESQKAQLEQQQKEIDQLKAAVETLMGKK